MEPHGIRRFISPLFPPSIAASLSLLSREGDEKGDKEKAEWGLNGKMKRRRAAVRTVKAESAASHVHKSRI